MFVKRLALLLPQHLQAELKRHYYARQIIKGTFASREPEYKILPDLIKPGDWAIDVGANVGYYTKRLSELVGPSGRVVAFEPVPYTFALLASNLHFFAHPNVTLVNAAVSDKTDLAGISLPLLRRGLPNYYQATLTPGANRAFSVLTLALDSLFVAQPITLVKIDTEGHEALVLKGMQRLLSLHHPTLIVETDSAEIIAGLASLGYVYRKLPHSPNLLFKVEI